MNPVGLLDLQERGAHDRGARHGAGRQGAPAAGGGQGPALPRGRPRRAQHGAERRALLPHGARRARSRAAGSSARTTRSATTRTWLKWINAEPDGDGMRIWTEDVPVADYPFQPAAREELTDGRHDGAPASPAHPRGAGQAVRQVLHDGARRAGPESARAAARATARSPRTRCCMPEDMNALLDPGNFETEIGWGMMDNGAGYIAMRHEMPGVTVEMIDWWFAWHAHRGPALPHLVPAVPPRRRTSTTGRSRGSLDPDVPVRDKCRAGRPPRHRGHGHGHGAHRHPLPQAGGDGLRHEPLRSCPTWAPSSAASASASTSTSRRRSRRRRPSCATSSARWTAASSGARASGWATRS